jgi:hypothetical protein
MVCGSEPAIESSDEKETKSCLVQKDHLVIAETHIEESAPSIIAARVGHGVGRKSIEAALFG